MSYSVGVNLMVWSGRLGPNELRLLPAIAEMGYDGVELPVFDVTELKAAEIRRALASSGLACTVSTALPVGVTLIDEEIADRGVAWLNGVIEAAATLGATVVCGPMAVPVGAEGTRAIPAQSGIAACELCAR